jgi:hypothetical protein
VESGQIFPDDERICAFLKNEPYKPKEVMYLEDKKFPKGLTPHESSFSTSDVGSHNNRKEDVSKRKIGDLFPLNIGTLEQPKVIKVGAQCSEQEKAKFMDLFCDFKDVFS